MGWIYAFANITMMAGKQVPVIVSTVWIKRHQQHRSVGRYGFIVDPELAVASSSSLSKPSPTTVIRLFDLTPESFFI